MAILVKGKWLNPVSIKLYEKKTTDTNYKFRATVLVWDDNYNKEWSVRSRNGARYNRKATVEAIADSIKRNNGIPFMHNHIIEGSDANQLGLVTGFQDTDNGLIIEGKLNGTNDVVKNEIVPGFLNNVSLQVDAKSEKVEEEEGIITTMAAPTDFFEISAVNVPGIPGANLLDVALAEAYKRKEDVVDDTLVQEQEVKEKDVHDEAWEEAKKEAGIITNVNEEGKVEDSEIVLDESLSEDLTTSNGSGAVGKALHGVDKNNGSQKDIEKQIKDIIDITDEEINEVHRKLTSN